MKTKLFMIMMLGIGLIGPVLQAEEIAKGRDLAVDNVLAGNGSFAGILPATAGQAIPAGTLGLGNQQPFLDPARPDQFPDPASMVSDKADKKGRVYEIQGRVKIAKKDSAEWHLVQNQAWIKQGDTVLTEKGAYVSVAFDAQYRNVTHIPENTRAVFRSIEPLDLFLEDGTVFNIFDGLSPNSQWKVSSPTAVAAVRGTHYAVRYTSSSGDFFTATFNVPDDAQDSLVELLDVTSGGGTGKSVEVPEGNQIDLQEGENLDASLLEGISPEWLEQIEEILERLKQQRQNQGGSLLPPTSGEFFEPNVIDPAGANMVGGGQEGPELDPLNDSQIQDFPEEIFEESSSSPEEPSEQETPREEPYDPYEPPYEEPGCGSECL